MHTIADADATLPLAVKVEVPQPWLDSERDGARNRDMFSTLKSVLADSAYDCHFAPIPFHTDFRPKHAPTGGFALSYHSCGDARHVWRIKETSIPHFYSFDRLGFSGWSEIAQLPERYVNSIETISPSRALDFVRNLAAWLRAGNLSKYKQSTDAFELREPFVFFPLQVRNDIVSRFNRLDPVRVLHRAARCARLRRIPLVVKRHPYCKSPVVAAALALESATNRYVKVTDASVQLILPACSTVLVGNSGVGFEALIHEKPVHAFARSEYEAFVSGVNCLEDVDCAFDLQDNSGAHSIRGAQFVRFFLENMCFDARTPESLRKQITRAEHCALHNIWCERSLCDLDARW